MNDTETRRIANAIREIVRKRSNRQILGAHLGSELRTAGGDPSAPLIFPGGLNLRQFISGHVTELCEIGRQGMDMVYALDQKAGPKEAAEPPILDQRAWKTFVSPNGPFRLFINPQTKTFLVRRAKDEILSELGSNSRPARRRFTKISPRSLPRHAIRRNERPLTTSLNERSGGRTLLTGLPQRVSARSGGYSDASASSKS